MQLASLALFNGFQVQAEPNWAILFSSGALPLSLSLPPSLRHSHLMSLVLAIYIYNYRLYSMTETQPSIVYACELGVCTYIRP